MNLKEEDLVKIIPQKAERPDSTVYKIVGFYGIPMGTENKKGAIIEKAYENESSKQHVLTERLRKHT